MEHLWQQLPTKKFELPDVPIPHEQTLPAPTQFQYVIMHVTSALDRKTKYGHKNLLTFFIW